MCEKSDRLEQIIKMFAVSQCKMFFQYNGNIFSGRIISCEEDALVVEKENGEFISVPYGTEFHSIDEHDDQHTQSIGKADRPFAKRRRQVWKYIHQKNNRRNNNRKDRHL